MPPHTRGRVWLLYPHYSSLRIVQINGCPTSALTPPHARFAPPSVSSPLRKVRCGKHSVFSGLVSGRLPCPRALRGTRDVARTAQPPRRQSRVCTRARDAHMVCSGAATDARRQTLFSAQLKLELLSLNPLKFPHTGPTAGRKPGAHSTRGSVPLSRGSGRKPAGASLYTRKRFSPRRQECVALAAGVKEEAGAARFAAYEVGWYRDIRSRTEGPLAEVGPDKQCSPPQRMQFY